MLIIPAIDILGGECVRLYKGDYSQTTMYNKDPIAAAREFERAGAKRLHIVDLDAARGGSKRNRKIIRKIRKAVSCPKFVYCFDFVAGLNDVQTSHVDITDSARKAFRRLPHQIHGG